MPQRQMLRALVNERLAAAAEEIFELLDRTISGYEEELRRSKKEIQRRQRLLDAVLNPRVLVPRVGAAVQASSPTGAGLNQEITQTAVFKEEPGEQRVKQEEEELPVSKREWSWKLPRSSTGTKTRQVRINSSKLRFSTEFSTVFVKTEESQETQEEDISSNPYFHTEHSDTEHSSDTDGSSTDSDDDSSSTDSDDDCSSSDSDDDSECPISCSDAQMETVAEGDQYNQIQIRNGSTAAQNSGLSNEYKSEPGMSYTLWKKPQCSVCKKKFSSKRALQSHSRVHRKDSCPLCVKHNVRKQTGEEHMETHTSKQHLSCIYCQRTFSQMSHLQTHIRTHSVGKPYSCSICQRAFTLKCNLTAHMKLHTGEKPYSCPFCNKGFTVRWNLKSHMKVHTKHAMGDLKADVGLTL